MPKGIFLPPALFANAHLLFHKLRFAAELKNKNIRFLHAVSSYAKFSDDQIIGADIALAFAGAEALLLAFVAFAGLGRKAAYCLLEQHKVRAHLANKSTFSSLALAAIITIAVATLPCPITLQVRPAPTKPKL